VDIYCFDSSAICKRYVAEIGSGWVNGIVKTAKGRRIYLARITGVEVISALARRGRSGSLSPAPLSAALAQFRLEFGKDYRMIEITPILVAEAMALAEQHALRGYDAVQLAVALHLSARRLAAQKSLPVFVSADSTLNAAARADGLRVDDPNLHP
jgi:predicted nucleic acid-binding protein